jgi:chromosome segregation ATPase
MRTFLMASMLSLVAAGGACKKDSSKDTDKAAESVRKNVEDVTEQKQDIRDEQKDITKEQQDVVKQQGELNQQLAELDAKTDAKSKEMASNLRLRRDELKMKLDRVDTAAAATWNDFTKDVDGSFDKIEHDLNDALD